MRIDCSRCGKHREINVKKPWYQEAVKAVNAGWGSYGNALYCPECAETWATHNKGKPMSGKGNTIEVIISLTRNRLHYEM